MKIIDISMPISENMHVYQGDPPPEIQRAKTIEKNGSNVSLISIGSHTGTHVDPPVHFISDGYTVDKIPLTNLVGSAKVFEVHGVKKISVEDLKELDITGGDIVLFKTDNMYHLSDDGFYKDFISLSLEGAKYLVEKGVKTIGIDYLSIEAFHGGGFVHRFLLGNGITVIEGLVLKDVKPGTYKFMCLPIKIKDGDGAPARAILIEE